MNTHPDYTCDQFFRGRLEILQPRQGFRAGMDSVVLAAAIPAQAGDKVLELGMGPGVAALCLAHRTQAHIAGIEIDPEIVDIATWNAAQNGLTPYIAVFAGDATQPKTIAMRGFNHVMMNPPFYSAHDHQTSPHAQKAVAMNSADDMLAAWVGTAITCLKPGGSLTAIVPPERMDIILAALGGKMGGIQILPIFTKADAPATRILLNARKGRKTPLAILPPFLTVNDKGGMSEHMRALAEEGAALNVFR